MAAIGRSIFFGDVHGCLEELDELLELLELRPADRLYFVGDLVDRGPDSIGAVRRVRELLACFPGSAAIAGNHEEQALRNRDKGRPLRDWAPHASDEDWAFLDALPLVHRISELGVVLVHGGFFPAFFEKEGPVGDVSAAWRRDRGKRADRLRRFLRVRWVNPEGNMVKLFDERPGDRHWSDVYDGREGFCFYGHDPQLEPPVPRLSSYAVGLDTGCCFGGRLTAAVLEAGRPPAEVTFQGVPARGQYAPPLRRGEEP